jgi:hypothetical protein
VAERIKKEHLGVSGLVDDEGRVTEVRYLTDDRDHEQRNELVITRGGNGDLYVAVAPEGQGTLGRAVRLSTSGGSAAAAPGLARAAAEMFRALEAVLQG